MAEQMALNLLSAPDLTRASFVEAASNAQARALLDTDDQWPAALAILTGPSGAGKTHLSAIWACERTAHHIDAVAPASLLETLALGQSRSDDHDAGAPLRMVLDGADQWLARHQDPGDQRWLFHCLQRAAGEGGRIVMTGRTSPLEWGVAVADIRSRLNAAPRAAFGDPDDALLGSVLAKQLREQAVRLEDGLIAFVVARMERSPSAAVQIAEALIERATALRRAVITKALARDVLADHPPEAV